ncbi:DUF4422 domain-containing protein [Pontimonas sp.]|nr:DUF4422 domain-containing protein [Pontimonas sp.]
MDPLTARIYVATHTSGPTPRGDLLRPIQVGGEHFPAARGIQTDSSGANISSLNPFFCELTATFWAWKNDLDSDFIGLFHYRRFLSLSAQSGESVERGEGTDLLGSPSQVERRLNLSQNGFRNAPWNSPSLIAAVPTRRDLREDGFISLRDQYEKLHIRDDLQIALELFATLHEHETDNFEKHLDQPFLYTGNRFIFRRDVFDTYASWLFPFLLQLHDVLDYSNRRPKELRAIGFLAERFTSFFIEELPLNGKVHLPRVFLRAPDIRSRSQRMIRKGRQFAHQAMNINRNRHFS